MKCELITRAYEIARERYAAIGVDTDHVFIIQGSCCASPIACEMARQRLECSIQKSRMPLSGLAVNGNYPGKARNIDELRADILYAMSLIPGKHRLNLHEIYGDFGGKFVESLEPTV